MKFHFTPPQGWINDPNGLIKIGEDYHIFYQYYPYDNVWGPMHWGHAVSKDLLHFTHLPIALEPDELGWIFSGSCVLDTDNLSGMGTADTPALFAFYTSHNPKTDEQQQCAAYSLDYVNFTKLPDNPVIPNRKDEPGYQRDFRDPKVFRNPVRGGYTMALAAGLKIDFYHSANLLNWEKTGEFDPAEYGFPGICECPDCIYIPESDRWVMLVSSILPEEKVGKPLSERGYDYSHVMQYFIGTFNGDTFVDTEHFPEPQLADYGPDNYAMVSFAGTNLLYGWGENWDYVRDTPPEDGHRGKMTVARRASLVNTPAGLRLSQKPVDNVPRNVEQTYDPSLVVQFETGPEEVFTLMITDNELSVNRSQCIGEEPCALLQGFHYQNFTAKRTKTGPCDVIAVRDGGYFEIFADDGTIAFSINVWGYGK